MDGSSDFYQVVLFNQYIKIMFPEFPVSEEFEVFSTYLKYFYEIMKILPYLRFIVRI